MIARMEKLVLYGLSEDREKILRGLMGKGCVELRSPTSEEELNNELPLLGNNDIEIYELEQRFSRIGLAINTLTPYANKSSLFAWRRRIAFSDYSSGGAVKDAIAICEKVEREVSELREQKSLEQNAASEISALIPWCEMDIPPELMKTGKTNIFPAIYTGKDSGEAFTEAIKNAGGVAVKTGEDGAGTYFMIVSHQRDGDAVAEAMRDFPWSRPTFDCAGKTAKESIALLEERAKNAGERIEELSSSIKKQADDIDILKLAYDATLLDIDCKRAGGKLLGTQKSFILLAWLPEKDEEKIKSFLEGFACYAQFIEADQNDPNMPVLLENPKWAKPFDSLTEMYSMPLPGSLDPGPFMTPFYFIFFGMMFSDAGYGLLMTVGCLLLLKFMDVSKGLKKLVQMLSMCGVSTMIWGIVYGSYFGDAVEVVAKTFFGAPADFMVPRLIDPMNQPMVVLVISMALGLLHIMFGMGLSAYMMIKRGHFWDAVFDIGFWYLVFIGLVLLVAGGTVGEIGKWVAIAGAAGLVLTQGRNKKNIFGKVTGGIMSLYGITNYFSDVLSYSRILALGLATAVISNVVNLIGTLFGANVVGAILFAIIFVGGHLLNFGINALGSYVHAARLQYVEFFGKFYESGGVPFTPLSANTKYTVAVSATEEKE